MTNTARATTAAAALKAFAATQGSSFSNEPAEAQIADLICNLLHLADAHKVTLKDSDLLGRALNHHRAELAEDGPKAELVPESAPEVAITCPHCADGEIICIEDATVTRKVIGSETRSFGSWPVLGDQEDVNNCGEDRLCCNSCDTTFYTEDIHDIVNGTYDDGETLEQEAAA